MAFSVNALTSAGNNLLAQATSANPIEYIDAIASTNSYTAVQIGSMGNPQDSGWDVSGYSEVVASSATDTTARIIAGLHNRPSATTIKTIGIIGKLVSQSASEAVVVAAISDSSASIRIPPTTEPPVRLEFAIDINISDSQNVVVTSSTAGSAMLSDLDRLVSCHKAGMPYTGEDQSVYGTKRFRAFTHFGDEITNYGQVDFTIGTNNGYHNSFIRSGTQASSIDDPIYQELRFHSYEDTSWTNCITTNVSIMPDHSNALSDIILGAPSAPFTEIYSDYATFDGVSVHSGIWFKYVPSGTTIEINKGSLQVSQSSLNFDLSSNVDFRLASGGLVQITAGTGNHIYITAGTGGGIFLTGGDTEIRGVASCAGLKFLDDLAPATCDLIPRTSLMKAGGIFLAYLANTSTTYNLSVGDLIPSNILVSAAKAVQGTSGGTITESYSSGTAFVNDGSSFRIMAEVTSFSSGKAIIAPVICVKDSAEQV